MPIEVNPAAVLDDDEPQIRPAPDASPGDDGAAEPVAVARLYGEPLFTLPTDLYIPPDALEIALEAFEGPLDLLLYLIRRQSFDILDIPMAALTRQYLGYVEQLRAHNLELAADYLLMAALLIEIKSRMLLPPRKAPGSDDEPEDPRAELVRRLVEYEQIKLAAARLDELPQQDRDVLVARAWIADDVPASLPDVSIDDLRRAWAAVLKRAKLVRHHTITREQLSVREHMSQVLRTLRGRRFAEFDELFDVTAGAPVVIVTFIALLELAREALVEITQAEAFAPIYVRIEGAGAD